MPPRRGRLGAQALAKLLVNPDDEPFELILLDLELAGMGSQEVARAIKAAPRYADVPLVLLTALESSPTSAEIADAPWAAKLTRPVSNAQLYAAICDAVVTPETLDTRRSVTEAVERSLASPLRILLAEDNEVNRRVAIGMVERLGCTVEAVSNGREAIEALDHDRHDLVLMDVQMPEMGGFAATAAIREREQATGRHIPVIAMTAHAMNGDRDRCLAAGMDDYLSKPIRPGPLCDALLAWGAEPESRRKDANIAAIASSASSPSRPSANHAAAIPI